MPRFLLLFFLASSLFLVQATPLFAISFVISNPVIDDDDDIEVDASISGLISSSCSVSGCYLQGELRALDESKGYFGFTKNNSDEFVDYFKPESVDEIKSKLFNFIPVAGSWSGKLNMRNNKESENYLGSGNYSLRFRRFTGNSTTATSGDSNLLTLELKLSTPTPTLLPTPTPTPNTPSPSPTPTPTARVTPTPLKSFVPTPTPFPSVSNTPSVSPSVNTKEVLAFKDEVEEKKSNPLPILVSIIGVLLIGVASFPFVKNKFREYNYNNARRKNN